MYVHAPARMVMQALGHVLANAHCSYCHADPLALGNPCHAHAQTHTHTQIRTHTHTQTQTHP